MAKKIEFENKVDLIDSPEVPDNQKMKASEFNDMRDAINQKIVAVGSTGVGTELAGLLLSQKQSTGEKVKVQLQDSQGVPYYVETSADMVYISEDLRLNEVLGGNLFKIAETENDVTFGNFDEWIASGKPKA